jgi:hypothetical protein
MGLTITFVIKLVKEEVRHIPAFEYRECFMSYRRKFRRYFLGLCDKNHLTYLQF